MPPKASTSAAVSLPTFLKLLTSAPKSRGSPSLTMSQAMQAAGKLLPAGYTSLERLKTLTQVDMAKLGIADEAIRKGIMALSGRGGGGSKQGSPSKRKRGSDLDRPLPTSEVQEVVQTDLDFEEILAVETLMLKSVVVNRAPVMTAWACVVAERLGFQRQEALSIAQVYTNLNATSKGISLGLLSSSSSKSSSGTSQPFVDLMGRKIPVISMQDGAWRGLSSGSIVSPSTAFSYLQRSLRQQLGAVIGALRVLAESFEPKELNEKGYGLYCEFRPESEGGVKGWGQKADMRLETILGLRKGVGEEERKGESEEGEGEEVLDGFGEGEEGGADEDDGAPPGRKRQKVEPEPDGDSGDKDEFDLALEDDLDLSGLGDY